MNLPVIDYERMKRVYSQPEVVDTNFFTRACLFIIFCTCLLLFKRFMDKKETF